MIPFAIIGAGWRAEFYLRVARACPDVLQVVGVMARSPEKVAGLVEEFGIAAYTDVEDMVKVASPTFVVTSVSWEANPGILRHLAHLKMPALSETPPAGPVEELRSLWRLVEEGANIQVAEQYHLQPHHAARLALAHSGRLGRVTQAQVSAAHGYHGISLIRRFLGIGFADAEVSAYTFASPLIQGPGRDGPPLAEEVASSEQLVARFDFGSQLGVFDFTGDQYFSPIRDQRLLVRGERGEIIDQTATYLQDYLTPIELEFRRQVAGAEGNLEGHYLKGIQAGEEWIYRNPLVPGRLTDDEIAVGHCLLKMAASVERGGRCYSLAEACQDRYLDTVMHEAASKSHPIQTEPQPWASFRDAG